MNNMDGDCAEGVRAAWVLVGREMEPMRDATVIIHEGRIAEITTKHHSSVRDLGNVVLIPGLVNAHTHLELSDLDQPLTKSQVFTGWVKDLMAHRRERTTSSVESMCLGLAESKMGGMSAVGDILSSQVLEEGLLPELLLKESRGLTGIYLLEAIGFTKSSAEETYHRSIQLINHYANLRPQLEDVVVGVSPHAPYSVRPQLVADLAQLATECDVPLAMHLAETCEELEFLTRQRGPLREMLEKFGVWEEGVVSTGTRVLDYLMLLEDVRKVLVVHGNYLDDEELTFLSEHQDVEGILMSVVYCPRTHAYFGHPGHRFREMLSMGINVCIGTDSRASSPNLSVFEELKFLKKKFPEISDAELLGMGTWRGAMSMGLEGSLGAIDVGKRARFAVIELGGEASDSLEERLFAEGSQARGLVS